MSIDLAKIFSVIPSKEISQDPATSAGQVFVGYDAVFLYYAVSDMLRKVGK